MSVATKVEIVFPVEQQDEQYPPVSTESLWCIPVDEVNAYRVDNIPFYVREISLGDLVEAGKVAGSIVFQRLLAKAPNSTVRVFVYDTDSVDVVQDRLHALGCSTERSDIPGLISVSIPNSTDVTMVLSFLDLETANGAIGFEESSVRYK